MSTINTSSPIDTRLANSDLESLRSGREQGFAVADGGVELTLQDAAATDAAEPSTDTGEDVLNASAWSGIPDGDRLLSGDTGFEASLGHLELSQAADSAADAVFDALF